MRSNRPSGYGYKRHALVHHKSGDILAVNNLGEVRFVIPKPIGWDSNPAATPRDLAVDIARETPHSFLVTISADIAWLQSDATQYPVSIDPSVQGFSDTTVTAYKSDGLKRTDGVHIGNTAEASGPKYWRSQVKFPYQELLPLQMIDASITASYVAGTANTYTGTIWSGACSSYTCTGTKLADLTIGSGSAASSNDVNLLKEIGTWFKDDIAGKSLYFRGVESASAYTYKQINTVLNIQYKALPNVVSTSPTAGSLTTQNPVISVSATDPEDTGLEYLYKIYSGSTIIFTTDWIRDSEYQIPTSANLSTNTTYSYRVWARDAFDKYALAANNQSSFAKYWEQSSQDSSGLVSFTTKASVAQPVAASASIQDGDTVTNLRPTITVDGVGNWNSATSQWFDPDTNSQIFYLFSLSSDPDGVSGEVATSGWVSTPRWLVPAGVLHNGSTQHLTVRTKNVRGFPSPEWSHEFTVNLRLGSNTISPMDTVGPVSLNLASGNVTTSVATPQISTLGGPIGHTFTYNSLDESNNGLVGEYFENPPAYGETTPSNWSFSGKEPVLVRQDRSINFKYVNGKSPVPSMDFENYLVRWTGYIDLTDGITYHIGMKHNNGAKLTIGNKIMLSKWTGDSSRDTYAHAVDFDSTKTVIGGAATPITIEFYQSNRDMEVSLWMKKSTDPASAFTLVPSSHLSTDLPVLPDGWDSTAAMAGSASTYVKAVVKDSSVVLHDRSGGVHTYKELSAGGYRTPRGEYGVLAVASAGLVTLTEDDGTVYQFNAAGKIKSVTAPGDVKKPAAPVVVYDSSGRIDKIYDPLSIETGKSQATRVVDYQYQGDSNVSCPLAANTVLPPTGYLCKIVYPHLGSSATFTALYYDTSKRLVSIVNPGSEQTSFVYQAGDIESVISPYTNDLIRAGQLPATWTTGTEINSKPGGGNKIQGIQLPHLSSAPKSEIPGHSYDFTSGRTVVKDNAGALVNTVTFDSAWRQLTATTPMGYTATQVWGENDTIQSVRNSATGLISTTVYDQFFRPTDTYGPAPTECFPNGSTTPNNETCPVVPAHTQTVYDNELHQLSTSTFGNPNLSGAPTSFSTSWTVPYTTTNGTTHQVVGRQWSAYTATSGVTYDGWSERATGILTFPADGSWQIKVTGSSGNKIYLADRLVHSNWALGSALIPTESTIQVSSADTRDNYKRSQRIRIEQRQLLTAGSINLWWRNGTNAEWEPIPASAIDADYGLVTRKTVFDSASSPYSQAVRNQVVSFGYTTPWLGAVTTTTKDPGGLSLSTTVEYENPTAEGSLMRMIRRELPAATASASGVGTSFSYYPEGSLQGAIDISPTCEPDAKVVVGGLLKSTTDSAGIVTYFAYDNWGRTIATKTNAQGWSCTKLDQRGRKIATVTPGVGESADRTVNIDYATVPTTGGIADPRTVTTTDSEFPGGHRTSTMNFWGQTISATDWWGITTATEFDTQHGWVLRSITQVPGSTTTNSTIEYTYDADGKVETLSRNGVTLANPTYNSTTGRQTSVGYHNGTTVTETYSAVGALSNRNIYLTDGVISQNVTRSQSGRIVAEQLTDGATIEQSEYIYDAVGRLTQAKIPGHDLAYGFGTTSCGATDAGLNGNRTSYTDTTPTQTKSVEYCYDTSDRLTSSQTSIGGQVSVSTPSYDALGNTTVLDGVTYTYDGAGMHVGSV
ncbi:PA14 domain-containing protein, partial [Microbacteriaceae bacterium MWH-Ta3]